MADRKVKYGIRFRRYCIEHEQAMLSRLDAGQVNADLLALHEQKIRWLQHERLAHLIVTFLMSGLFLFSIALFTFLSNPLALVLAALSLILLAAYIRHYFFLENRVQYWYQLYDELHTVVNKK